MAQDPIKVDQLQIEPGAAGTRLIDRDPATGAMRLQDAVTSAITLAQMAGLRNIANVLIVGKSGAGAPYTTIQAALNAVPNAADPENPYLILVMPGVYEETVNVTKNGISLVGIGRPGIRDPLFATPNAVGNDHTVIISAQGGTIPEFFFMSGFNIANAHDNKACVRIVEAGGGSTVGGNGEGIDIRDCLMYSAAPGGGRTLWTTAVNTVGLVGCDLVSDIAAASTVIEETAQFTLRNSRCSTQMTLRWDTANDLPADAATAYLIENCHNLASSTALVPAISVDLDGGSYFIMQSCDLELSKRIQFSGDQGAEIYNSSVGVLSVLETMGVKLYSSNYASVLAPNANAVLDATVVGTAAFAAAATVAVSFDVPQTDSGYRVDLELDDRPANDEVPWITNKLATGFTINFNTAQTLNAGWRTMRT